MRSLNSTQSGRLLLLGGPTASGKTEVAVLLAERLGGEVVSVDSMQVYRGLNIGTAKPTAHQRARVRHHVLDILDLWDHFDASQFVTLARQAISDIRTRGHLPVLCGGTGLYFKALLFGLGSSPQSEPALRRELENTPLPLLLEELARQDPLTYHRIDRNNPRRVIRAVEVIRLTRRPYSEQRADWQRGGTCLEIETGTSLLALARSPGDLNQRIDCRVDEMFRSGLVEETRELLRVGLEQNRLALQAIGYRQVVEHLHGKRSLEETIRLVKSRTRQFAKRQLTWLRHQLPVEWIEVVSEETPESVATRIEALFRKSSSA